MRAMRTRLNFFLRSGYFSSTLMLATGLHAAENESSTRAPHAFNITDFGGKGDGATLNTRAINEAIEACTAVGGGQVLIPPGRFLSGTIHLRSHLTLFLAAGATLVGTPNLELYQQPAIPSLCPRPAGENGTGR